MAGDKNDEDLQEIFDAEKIVQNRTRKKKVEYLIKWKDYPESENSWVPCSDVSDDLIDEFNDRQMKKSNTESTSKTKNKNQQKNPKEKEKQKKEQKQEESDSEEQEEEESDSEEHTSFSHWWFQIK